MPGPWMHLLQLLSGLSWRALISLTLLLLAASSASAQVTGYTTKDGELNRIDLGSSELTAIGSMGGFSITGLAFDLNETLYGVDRLGHQLVTIDTATGAATAVGPLGFEIGRFDQPDITFDACGSLWLTTGGEPSLLYSIDPASGAATLVGDMTKPPNRIRVVSLTASGDRIVGLTVVNNLGWRLVDVDPLTAELYLQTELGSSPALPPWIDFDFSGLLWGFSSGTVLAPPEPGRTMVMERFNGSARVLAETSLFTLFAGLAVDRPYGVCVAGACRPGATLHCLNRRRFKVEVEWQDFAGNTGFGRPVPGASDDSGMFWFFEPDNWELQVKVLDGCVVNGNFWVLSSATTNVGFVLRVTDTMTGEVKEYSNALGEKAETILDPSAFFSCSRD